MLNKHLCTSKVAKQIVAVGRKPNGTYFAIKVAVTLRVTNAKGHVLRPASLGE